MQKLVAAAGGPYEAGLEPRPANFEPLSPLSLLKRAARISSRLLLGSTWRGAPHLGRNLCPLPATCSALERNGIERLDTVSIMASNIPAMYEAHFAVPMAGAVLNTINTRLDPTAVAFVLDHSDSKLLLVSEDYLDVARKAVSLAANKPPAPGDRGGRNAAGQRV